SEDLARQAKVTLDYGRPFVDRLVADGLVVRSAGTLVLTTAGHAAAERLFTARREGLRELLADWSPEEYAELGELLTKLSRAMLGADADRNVIASPARAKEGKESSRHVRARILRPPRDAVGGAQPGRGAGRGVHVVQAEQGRAGHRRVVNAADPGGRGRVGEPAGDAGHQRRVPRGHDAAAE